MGALLVVHAAATWTMLGVILVVQAVHYPLFAKVGSAGWVAYARGHGRRIAAIVVPLMLLELGTGVALVVVPSGVPAGAARAGLGLLAAIWASTAAIQVPLHRRLADGFDPVAHRRLVATNWLRTGCWAARAALVAAMLTSRF